VLSITADRALRRAASASVLACCVDNDAARLGAAILATCYHQVLIDVGTAMVGEAAVSYEHDAAPPRPEADVRLILPDEGCILCCGGGVSNHQRAVEDLCDPNANREPQDQFGTGRLGSLRSMNQFASGLAVGMLEDLLVGRLTTSCWAHVEVATDGKRVIRYPEVGPRANCRLCPKTGLGDASGLGGHRQGCVEFA
jgi:hypothetical protein